MPEPVFMKLRMHIMTPKRLSMLYLINYCDQSICISVSLLGNGLVKTVPRQRIHTLQYNHWTHRFLCAPRRVKGK
jgi:hypothetical protein